MTTTNHLTRRSVRATVFVTALVAVLALAVPADAFRMIQPTSTGRVTSGNLVTCDDPGGFAHWDIADIDWYHNTAGQGSGKATALQSAMSQWTNVANANHILTYKGTTTAGWSTDGRNTLLWASGNGCTGGCLALTALVIQTGHEIVESDITFNSNYTWNTNGSDYDVWAVATHELGHSLGIHHSELGSGGSFPPTMAATYFGTGARSPEADDQAALQCAQSKYPVLTTRIPATPSSLTITRKNCYGWNIQEWSSVVGTDNYELQSSASSSFTSPTLRYSGPATQQSIGVSTTTYFRVRACNHNGCSSYKNGNQSATFYNGCPPSPY